MVTGAAAGAPTKLLAPVSVPGLGGFKPTGGAATLAAACTSAAEPQHPTPCSLLIGAAEAYVADPWWRLHARGEVAPREGNTAAGSVRRCCAQVLCVAGVCATSGGGGNACVVGSVRRSLSAARQEQGATADYSTLRRVGEHRSCAP